MERLTVPDEPIEGGMRRVIIDARAVREEAMTIYWALKKYEDTGLTPAQLREIDKMYSEQAKELMAYKRAEEDGLLVRTEDADAALAKMETAGKVIKNEPETETP